jgi:GNAT superfamily N-acetyltransferase
MNSSRFSVRAALAPVILKPLDDIPVWLVTRFFVKRKFRNQGLTVALLKAAIDYVAQAEGEMVEG